MRELRLFALVFIVLSVAAASRLRHHKRRHAQNIEEDALLKSANVLELVAEENERVKKLMVAETGMDLPSSNPASRHQPALTLEDASCLSDPEQCCRARLIISTRKNVIAPQKFYSYICIDKKGNMCGRKFSEPLDIVYADKDEELITREIPFAVGMCEWK